MSVTVFDLDDLCDEFDPYDELIALKEKFHGLKVTLFAIPARCSQELLDTYRDLDWVELAVHGYHHAPQECATWDYDETSLKLAELEAAGWKKVFKAPGWIAHEQVYQALTDAGWIVADNVQLRSEWGESRPLRYCDHAWDVNGIHGHTWDTDSNGPRSWPAMFADVPADAEFAFVSEVARSVYDEWDAVTVGGTAADDVVKRWMEAAGIPCNEQGSERRCIWSWWGAVVPGALKAGDVLVVHHLDKENKKGDIVYRDALRVGAMIVVPNDQTFAEFRNKYGVNPNAVIPYLMPEAPVYPQVEKFTAGIIGQDSPHKNFDAVRSACTRLGVPLVDWAKDGIVEGRDKEDFYKLVSVVVSPSDMEGGPLPPMEALQRGRLALTTRCGVMPLANPDGLIDGPGKLDAALLALKKKWPVEAVNRLPAYFEDAERAHRQWWAALSGSFLGCALEDMDLREGDLFVDVGAHKGEEIEVLQPLGVKVLSFEPHPDRAAELQQRWGGVEGVEIVPKAAGASNRTCALYESAQFSSGSTTEKSKRLLGGRKIDVEMVRLADVIRDREVKVLKLDVEGTEWEILEDLLDEGILQQCGSVFVEDHTGRMDSPEIVAIKERVLKRCRKEGVVLREWV